MGVAEADRDQQVKNVPSAQLGRRPEAARQWQAPQGVGERVNLLPAWQDPGAGGEPQPQVRRGRRSESSRELPAWPKALLVAPHCAQAEQRDGQEGDRRLLRQERQEEKQARLDRLQPGRHPERQPGA